MRRELSARSPEEKGLGLATMKGRAQMVGGVLELWTQEGKGTRITLSIPIQRGATWSWHLIVLCWPMIMSWSGRV